MITFVYAQDKKGAIGYKQDLPWHMPNDLKFFKRVTMGHTILMGRTTFESMDCRLLPGRETVVLTTQEDYGKDIQGITVIHSVQEGLDLAKDQEVMVIGGSHVFMSFMPYADKIIRTIVQGEFPADTFMPDIDRTLFTKVKSESVEADEANPYDHIFEWWERIEPATKGKSESEK